MMEIGTSGLARTLLSSVESTREHGKALRHTRCISRFDLVIAITGRHRYNTSRHQRSNTVQGPPGLNAMLTMMSIVVTSAVKPILHVQAPTSNQAAPILRRHPRTVPHHSIHQTPNKHKHRHRLQGHLPP